MVGQVKYCYECQEFPCRNLQHIDKRYRANYRMSMIENLEYIRDRGIAAFLDKEAEKDIRRGCPLEASSPPFQRLPDAQSGERCRAYGENGSLIAILRYDADSSQWRPQKVFSPAHPAF